jgi:hypothetical protein
LKVVVCPFNTGLGLKFGETPWGMLFIQEGWFKKGPLY